MGSLDSAFVLEPEHRPNLNSADEAEGVPLIDLSLSSAQTRENLLSEIRRACRDWGFFQVVNHGIPSNVRDRAMELAKWFFGQELEEKAKVRKDEVSHMGYHDGEYTKNVRDWKEIFDFFLQDPTVIPASADFDDGEVMMLANRWPLNSPEFRDVLEGYAKEYENLAFRILELVSMSLGLPANRLNDYFKEQTSVIRLNHYPPCPQPELALGFGRHKDSGVLTILFQDAVGGLQVCRRSDGKWVSVRPVQDAYVVNLGNTMQVWSNDEYWSAEHRVVVNTESERFSIPFFFLPASNVQIKPIKELTSDENPPKYKEFKWGKFLVNRMRGHYQNLKVEDIQMDNFKVGLSPTSNVDMGAVVDPAFIQDVEHRSKLSMTVDESIPTIDLSDSREDIPSLVMEIGKACKEWGFFQVINHGVPSEKRARLDAAARRFFALPLEEKRKVRRDETKVIGYYDTGHTRNVRDWKEVFDVTVHDPTYAPASYDPEDREITQWWNQWPENPPELREACEDYIEEMEKLAFRLMGLIVLSLGLSGERFRSFFEGHTSFMRLNHYPPCPDPRLALGISGHKDSGVLTILAQDDVSGLEVKRKRDGEWILVRPAQDVLIINIGDVIQVWSNEAYESAEHRAILNPDRDRLSVPFFFFPGHHVMVEPLKELCGRGVGGREAVYRPYNWGKFLATRKRSNFMKLDVDNIQIRHFKLNA